MTPQRDFGASLSELKDIQGTRYELRRTGRTWAKVLFFVGCGAAFAGFGNDASILWWVLAATLTGISGAIAVWNR